MTTAIAYLTSQTSHGGQVVTASPDRYANNLAVARLNDLVTCPDHDINPIVSITITQQTNNLTTANVTAVSACGSTIITGSTDIFVG